MKHTLRIPAKEQYAYIEVEFEGTADEAIQEYKRVTALTKEEGIWEKVDTFTGETILVDKKNHNFKDLYGNKLYGGTSYKKSIEKDAFDVDLIAPKTAKKLDIDEQLVRDMWEGNRIVSITLGNALHYAMEQYFKHRAHGTEREYHMAKHPFLSTALKTFPYINEKAIPEVYVSDVKNRRVGQIDLLIYGNDGFTLVDYKTDAELDKKKVVNHYNQLSWYAHQLIDAGFPVEKLLVMNYTDKWYEHESPVLDLIL